MKKLAILPVLALALMPVATVLPTAHAATADLTTVSITVSLDLPTAGGPSDPHVVQSAGPRVFQVTDVPVGDGPELTGADEVSNPSNWGGSVTVDVDNATHQITVATEDDNDFQTAVVTVTGEGLGPITLVSDNLWEPLGSGPERTPATTPAGMPLTVSSADGTATMSWAADPAGVDFNLAADGAAIFSFEAVAPTTTISPTTTAPPAAAPAVQAAPAFTG